MPDPRFTETTPDDAETRFQAAPHEQVRFTGPDGTTVDMTADLATASTRTWR